MRSFLKVFIIGKVHFTVRSADLCVCVCLMAWWCVQTVSHWSQNCFPLSANPQLPLKAIKKHTLKMPGSAVKSVSLWLHVFVRERQNRVEQILFFVCFVKSPVFYLNRCINVCMRKMWGGWCKVGCVPPGRIWNTFSVTTHTRYHKTVDPGLELDFL